MTIRTLATALLTLVLVASSSLTASAQSLLAMYYDPATGNLKLQNTTSGSQGFQSFRIITLGNGSLGAVSGQPGNIGFMSTGTATLPTFSFPVSNTSVNGVNGIFSELGGANIGAVSFSLSGYPGWSAGSPIGPVGSYWDLGNIALPGMTQADLNTRFLTDPEDASTGGEPVYGKFVFSNQLAGGSFSQQTLGDIQLVTPIPEPSTYAMLIAGAVSGGFMVRRRRKTA